MICEPEPILERKEVLRKIADIAEMNMKYAISMLEEIDNILKSKWH